MNKREYLAEIYDGKSVIKELTNGSLTRIYPFGEYNPSTWALVSKLAPIIQSIFEVYSSYLDIEKAMFIGEEFSDSIRVEIKFINRKKEIRSGNILVQRKPIDFVEIGKKVINISKEFGGPKIWRFIGLEIRAT